MKYRYTEVETPAYFITGWYDNLVHEGFKCFKGWRTQARTPEAQMAKTKLLVGPWTHSAIGSPEPFGDIELWFQMQRWIFRGRPSVGTINGLKGIDTGIDDEPPIRIFVMGAERLARRARVAPRADPIHQVLPPQWGTCQLPPRRR